jgi:hypothetical protein
MMKKFYAPALLAAVIAGGLSLSLGTANAVTWKKCPDGSVVTDVQPCGKFKTAGKGGQARSGMPKGPKHSDKTIWINDGYKPKPRPKG